MLAFDFGLKHIGVAAGQTITGTASSIATLSVRNGKLPEGDLQALLAEWRPERLLVGLPLNMDGTESDMSGHARRFADRLRASSGLPVSLVDERLSSREATSRLNAARRENVKQGNRAAAAGSVHALAACIIAETYFSSVPRTGDRHEQT